MHTYVEEKRLFAEFGNENEVLVAFWAGNKFYLTVLLLQGKGNYFFWGVSQQHEMRVYILMYR